MGMGQEVLVLPPEGLPPTSQLGKQLRAPQPTQGEAGRAREEEPCPDTHAEATALARR